MESAAARQTCGGKVGEPGRAVHENRQQRQHQEGDASDDQRGIGAEAPAAGRGDAWQPAEAGAQRGRAREAGGKGDTGGAGGELHQPQRRGMAEVEVEADRLVDGEL